jgi:D-3-phosphoglycerate dehydrogenase
VINCRAYSRFDAALLEQLPHLGIVAVFGTGVDNIDVATATRLGILVTNAAGANARSVAEHAIALMFAVARALPRHERALRAGQWVHFDGMELAGKTFGVIGLGAIGGHAARMAAGLGMQVLGWSRTADTARARAAGIEMASLDDVLRRADVLSLHLATTPETRGVLNRERLALLKPTAIVINTARGALIDEPALVDALTSSRIAGAGLDVFAEEPLPPGHPLVALDNVVLTPHAGWLTREARERTLAVPVANIAAWLAGTPQNVLNPEALAANADRLPVRRG